MRCISRVAVSDTDTRDRQNKNGAGPYSDEDCKFFHKFAYMKSCINLILTMMLFAVCSCSSHSGTEQPRHTGSLQQLIDRCNHYRDIGHQDSVAALTLPYLKGSLAAQDSLGVQVNFWLRAASSIRKRVTHVTTSTISSCARCLPTIYLGIRSSPRLRMRS